MKNRTASQTPWHIVAFFLLGWICSQPGEAQSILPEAPGSINGGNPFQGLGRPDDPGPARYQDFAKKNLQDSSTSDTGGGFSSDLYRSTSDTADSSSPGLLSPDLLKGLESGLGAGSESTESDGGQRPIFSDGTEQQGNGLPETPTESSDRSQADTSDTAPRGSNGSYGSSKGGKQSSNRALAGADGDSSLPPEPEGESKNLPSLATPLNVQSLSAPPDKSEAAKNSQGATANGSAPTGGALEKDSSTKQTASHNRIPTSRRASPLSASVSDRIRQALESRERPAQPVKEKKPPQLQLVPAPPPNPVSMPPTGPTPERQALSLMQHGDYPQAEKQLREFVLTEPQNYHARYLFAVTLVFNKKYDEAKTNYALIIRHAQDKKLVDMADSGLQKLLN